MHDKKQVEEAGELAEEALPQAYLLRLRKLSTDKIMAELRGNMDGSVKVVGSDEERSYSMGIGGLVARVSFILHCLITDTGP